MSFFLRDNRSLYESIYNRRILICSEKAVTEFFKKINDQLQIMEKEMTTHSSILTKESELTQQLNFHHHQSQLKYKNFSVICVFQNLQIQDFNHVNIAHLAFKMFYLVTVIKLYITKTLLLLFFLCYGLPRQHQW